MEESIILLNNIDTRKETNVMSKNYVRIWEQHHRLKLPENMEIHHIDGIHTNNDPTNLLAVTIEQHLDIHRKQNDYGACQAILMRMNRTEEQKKEIAECASKHQKKLLRQKKHNFQIPKEERIKRSKEIMQKRIGEHGIAFLGISDTKQNAKNARTKLSRETELRMMKKWNDKVRNTKWWVNPQGKRKRCINKPGDEWKEGMYYEN